MDYRMLCFGCMNVLERPDQICPHCGHNNMNRSNGQGYLSACVLEGQYVVGRMLGQGGFGVTYLGFDLNHTTLRTHSNSEADTRRVRNMNGMFLGCRSLKQLTAGRYFKIPSQCADMYKGCPARAESLY